ncbi:MAG: hypothetical protein ACKVK3_03860 [Acidimicrobiales bacterium]|jgi:hypothetical protein
MHNRPPCWRDAGPLPAYAKSQLRAVTLNQHKITVALLNEFVDRPADLEAAGEDAIGRRLVISQTRTHIAQFEADFDALATTDEIPIEDLR